MAHYIGVDLHKAFFQVCTIDETGARGWEARFPTTVVGIAAFGARLLPASHVAVEASGPTWWFVDQLQPRVARIVVVDAAKTRLKAGYAAKTDRLDARRLADALRRESVVSIYYPSPRLRDLRELSRHRITLVRTGTTVRQRLRALLLRHGQVVTARDLTGLKGQRALAAITLPGWAGASLESARTLLAYVTATIEPVEAAVQAHAQTDPITVALDRLGGIGPVLAVTLRAEIGDIARFPTAGHLASYAGLVPRVSGTGGVVRYGPITKRGSSWLRWALVEAAIHAPKRQDGFGRWARKLAGRKGALKARVAVARALCDEIYRVWPRTA